MDRPTPNSGLGLSPKEQYPTTCIIDKSIFHERPDCVVKEGVWIQVESQPARATAVHDALVEQQKILKIVDDKETRLKQFQRSVRQRVTKITRAQRELMSKAQSENMKEEQEILYRSVAAAEVSSPKKDGCTYNVNQVTIDASGKLTAHYKHEYPREHGSSALLKQSCEMERLHRKARQSLAQRCVVGSQGGSVECDDDDWQNPASLPGGLWGTSASRDKSAARILSSKKCGIYNGQVAEIENEPQTINAAPAPHDIAIAAVQEGIASSPIIKSWLKKDTRAVVLDLPTADVEKEEIENQDPELEFYTVQNSAPTSSSLHFKAGAEREWKRQEIVPCESCPKQVAVTRLRKNLQREQDVAVKLHHCHFVDHKKSEYPVAAPGVIEHERRRMDERSRLLSRRVFSDMEREKAREERRRREHKSKVERLRTEKEAERQEMEKEHDGKVHAAAAKLERQRIAKEMREERKIKKHQRKLDKEKRAERFAAALKAQIRQKLEMNKISLPPLCCCSTSFWGTDPWTCANNCVFYRNMNAYAAALESVLSTVEKGMAASCKHVKIHDHSVISLLMENE